MEIGDNGVLVIATVARKLTNHVVVIV